MKILPFVLCSTLLSTSAFASSTNIIINAPNAGVQDPVVNDHIESDNVVVGKDSTFSGVGSLIIGANSTGQDQSVAIGNHTSAAGESIALGAGSVAKNNSIAIGNQSYSDDGQVSIGNEYHQRRIENMAAGQKDTDGVNVSQLTPLKEGIATNTNQIKTVETNVATNSTDITNNKGAISTNSTDITNNKGGHLNQQH
ncbi:hypothetical protein AYY20_13210 [Photobacterium aquimaris]|uniref:hypothetical protein n=1 Tax=Photobacterium aquimaris TaxID=512643 RepID=UPI0007EFA2DA|nr:hypothetical protein [Photobacterium aquimaris]OBU21929.1 hypothetical protein AYY20_13210 [Photobacterium aquimaris]